MNQAFICDAIRTPFGRYGGALSSVRTDDLGAIPLRALMARNPKVDWAAVTDVLFGCANQAGEDNRNVAHMASLLAGLPIEVPGATINRLCGSGLDAVGTAARAIRAGEAGLMIAGGVESMSRAPVRHAQSRERLQPRQRGVRHHHRLAFRQQTDEGAVRRGLHARDRGERRHRIRHSARSAGQDGHGQPDEGRGGAESRPPGPGDHRSQHSPEKGRCRRRGPGRAPARNQSRSAGQAQAHRSA